ncbi:hypothetical protein [Bradyrhizobium sp. 2]|uniref:hypothetical protein n=1 Tax=Bradyrhizobium sp. 2 TaxID=190045 RepID=UPI001FFA33F9|nr:hypothetical protein [Bradyrhizobium sp. 2]
MAESKCALYLAAGKPSRFLAPLVKYWGDAKIADINSGSIRQSAIDLYPNAKNSTRNRQVIVPTLAVINHCAELGHCSPLRMKRFKVDTKIKKPVTLEWINAFRAAAERPDIGALALFMFATGARVSEARCPMGRHCTYEQWVLIRQTKLGNERRAHIPAQLLVALANLPATEIPSPSPTPQQEIRGLVLSPPPALNRSRSTVAATASLQRSTTKGSGSKR